jgi:diguanylate cyclase (GGDEF)-like protein/PAS domain S-box-containing protein
MAHDPSHLLNAGAELPNLKQARAPGVRRSVPCGVVSDGRRRERSVDGDGLGDLGIAAPALLDALGEAVIVADAQSRVVHWNPAAERLYGHAARDAIGRSSRELTTTPDQAEALVAVSRSLRAGQRWTSEFVSRHRDGTPLHLRVTVNPCFVEGAFVGTVAIAVDLSEVHAARAAERQLAAIVESSDDAIAAFDLNGVITAWSPGAVAMLGWTAAEAVGRDRRFLLPPELCAEDDTVFAHVRLGRRVDRIDTVRLHRDGTEVPLSLTITPLRADGGVVTGASIIARKRGAHDRGAVAAIDAEVRFRTLLERSNEVVIVCDEHGSAKYVSPSAEHLLGLQPDDLLHRTLAPLTTEEDERLVDRAFRRVLDDPELHPTVVFRRRLPGAEVQWAEATMSNLLDDPVVGGVVLNVRDVTERTRAADELRRLASHDLLTGLPNRTLFLERLRYALERSKSADGVGSRTAVLFLDLDDFKDVNDSHGHDAGDQLLLEIARRLGATLREGDTVARFGGDEFVVLCVDVRNEQEVLLLAERLLDELGRPMVIGNQEVHPGASLGIAIGPPGSATELIRQADAAMYRAKDLGGGTWALYDESLGLAAAKRLQIQSDLRRAIDRGELELHYQPAVDQESGVVIGLEGLARWRHRERGIIQPAEFIDVAETSGLILEIGRVVVQRACCAMASWRAEGVRLPVSVNISARQLLDRDFIPFIASTLDEYGIGSRDLTIEITESAVLADPDHAAATVAELRALGVTVALDDFGTGYSSLSVLRTLRVDLVKIDRSFVNGLGVSREDERIVASVVGLARTMGMWVVAEGVETEEQARWLLDAGCRYAQGFLWSRPVEHGAVLETVRALQASLEVPHR